MYLDCQIKLIAVMLCAMNSYLASAYDLDNPDPSWWDILQASNDALEAETKAWEAKRDGDLIESNRQQEKAREARRAAQILEERMGMNKMNEQRQWQNQEEDTSNICNGMSASMLGHNLEKNSAWGTMLEAGNVPRKYIVGAAELAEMARQNEKLEALRKQQQQQTPRSYRAPRPSNPAQTAITRTTDISGPDSGATDYDPLQDLRDWQRAWRATSNVRVIPGVRWGKRLIEYVSPEQDYQQSAYDGDDLLGSPNVDYKQEMRQPANRKTQKDKPTPWEYVKWCIADSATDRSMARNLARRKFRDSVGAWYGSTIKDPFLGPAIVNVESKKRSEMALFEMYATDYDDGWFQTVCPDPSDYKKWDKSRFILHYTHFKLRYYYSIGNLERESKSANEYRQAKDYRNKICNGIYYSELRQEAVKLWNEAWGR